jgi:hypothetical protein
MVALSQVPRRGVRHQCIFGDSKSGKTTLVAQLARKYKLKWLSIDNGHDVLYKLPPEAQANIDIIVLPDTKDFPVAISTCLRLISGAPMNVCIPHGNVECQTCKLEAVKTKVQPPFERHCFNELGPEWIVVFDHISQLANSAMHFILKRDNRPDDYKPGWDEYRPQGTMMDKFLTNIQQAPFNVICIAQLCETEMEDGKKKLVPLVGSYPFSRGSPKYFDDIIYCSLENKSHKFGSSTTYSMSALTGSRADVAVEKLEAKPDQAILLEFFDKEPVKVEHYAQAAANSVGTTVPGKPAGTNGVQKAAQVPSTVTHPIPSKATAGNKPKRTAEELLADLRARQINGQRA